MQATCMQWLVSPAGDTKDVRQDNTSEQESAIRTGHPSCMGCMHATAGCSWLRIDLCVLREPDIHIALTHRPSLKYA